MEDLQQMEVRALAAEVALVGAAALAQMTLDFSIHPSPSLIPAPHIETLKLIANVQVDTPAARELIEKAERLDQIESCAKELYEVLKESYQAQDSDPLRVYCLALASGLASSWLVGKIENGYIVGLDHVTEGPITVEFRKENGKTCIESTLALRSRLRESEALVERLKGGLQSLHSQCEEHLPGYAYSEQETANEELLALTPANALKQYRGEVLEEVAEMYDRDGYRNLAAEIRAMEATEKGGTR